MLFMRFCRTKKKKYEDIYASTTMTAPIIFIGKKEKEKFSNRL